MLAAARSIRLSVPLFCELALPPVVRLELGDDALAKNAQGREQSVELVQRVGAARLRIDVELESDPIGAVGNLEDHPRLEVVRAGSAVLVVAVVLQATLARVLDVGDHVGAAVEAGQVQEPALADTSAIRQS